MSKRSHFEQLLDMAHEAKQAVDDAVDCGVSNTDDLDGEYLAAIIELILFAKTYGYEIIQDV